MPPILRIIFFKKQKLFTEYILFFFLDSMKYFLLTRILLLYFFCYFMIVFIFLTFTLLGPSGFLFIRFFCSALTTPLRFVILYEFLRKLLKVHCSYFLDLHFVWLYHWSFFIFLSSISIYRFLELLLSPMCFFNFPWLFSFRSSKCGTCERFDVFGKGDSNARQLDLLRQKRGHFP